MNISRLTGVITTFALALTISTADARQQPESSRAAIKRIVVEEALATNVPPSLALAVAKVESDFQAHVESSAGARGVMQIMPATGTSEWGVNPDELWDPRLNVRLGIDYLSQLIERYDGNWEFALSFYNGGSKVGKPGQARVLPWTRKYVNNVLRWERRYATQENVWMALLDREDRAAGRTPHSKPSRVAGLVLESDFHPTAGPREHYGEEEAEVAVLQAKEETGRPIRPRVKWTNPRVKSKKARVNKNNSRVKWTDAKVSDKQKGGRYNKRPGGMFDDEHRNIEQRRRAIKGTLDDFS